MVASVRDGSSLRELLVQAVRRALQQGTRAGSTRNAREEPRSIVQSRTIERRVLVTVLWRSPRERQCRGEQTGPAVEGHAPGVRSGQGARLPSARATQRDPSRWVRETAGFVCPALAGAPLVRRERAAGVECGAPWQREAPGGCVSCARPARSLALPWGHSGVARLRRLQKSRATLRQQGVDERKNSA